MMKHTEYTDQTHAANISFDNFKCMFTLLEIFLFFSIFFFFFSFSCLLYHNTPVKLPPTTMWVFNKSYETKVEVKEEYRNSFRCQGLTAHRYSLFFSFALLSRQRWWNPSVLKKMWKRWLSPLGIPVSTGSCTVCDVDSARSLPLSKKRREEDINIRLSDAYLVFFTRDKPVHSLKPAKRTRGRRRANIEVRVSFG